MGDRGGNQVDVRLALEPEPGADTEEAERLGRQLWAALEESDVDAVTPLPSGEPPSGAKAGTATLILEWLVTISGTGGVLATTVATVRDWLSRGAGDHKVKITIAGDVLELDRATAEERSELIEVFLREHQSA